MKQFHVVVEYIKTHVTTITKLTHLKIKLHIKEYSVE